MRVLNKRLSRALYLTATLLSPPPSSSPLSSTHHAFLISRALTTRSQSWMLINCSDHASRGVLSVPWSATQLRGAKLRGIDVSFFFFFFKYLYIHIVVWIINLFVCIQIGA